jgi:hypothetical protein
MKWEGHVARTGKIRDACSILVGKSDWRRLGLRFRRGWDDSIKNVFTGLGETLWTEFIWRMRGRFIWQRNPLIMERQHSADKEADGRCFAHLRHYRRQQRGPHVPPALMFPLGRLSVLFAASPCARPWPATASGWLAEANTAARKQRIFAQAKSLSALPDVEVRIPAETSKVIIHGWTRL